MTTTTTRLALQIPDIGQLAWGDEIQNSLSRIDSSYPVFNVMSAAFGAVGDGSTDDTTAIQAAITAVPSTGGIVLLGPRHKVSTNLVIANDCVTLMGLGVGERLNGTQLTPGSRIEPTNAVTGQVIKVQRVADDRPVLGVTLRDFCVEGQGLGSAVDGILYRSNRGLIHNVAVYRMTGNGIHCKGYAGWSLYDSRVYGVQAGSNSAAGIYLETRAEDMHFGQCILFSNQDGIRISSASEQIVGCHFYDNSRYGAFFDAGGTRTKMVGCKVEGNKAGGARLETTSGNGMSGIQIVGNGFANNFDVTTNVIDDIYIGGDAATGCSGTQIVGNCFENKGGGGASVKARSFVNLINNAAQGTQVTGNRFARASASLHVGTEYVIDGGNTSQYLKSFVANNIGMTTMQSGFDRRGTGTVANGATTAVITHGLDRTPNIQDIWVTPTSDTTNDYVKFWVSTVTSTQFTVNVKSDPGSGGLTFAWRATT